MEAMVVGEEQRSTVEAEVAHRRAMIAIVATVCVMLSATVGAGWVTKNVVEKRVQSFFERQADQVASTYYDSIFTSVLMIEGMRGLWESHGEFDYSAFSTYVKYLTTNLEHSSGVSSFFYVKQIPQEQKSARVKTLQAEKNIPEEYQKYAIHPESESENIYPVWYVEPLAGRESSLGLDFGTFPDRLSAIEYARDNNNLATTKSVILLTTGKPGFFFLLPVYRPINELERVSERREAFVGLIGAAYRSEDAFKQIFGQDDPYPYLDFQVYQGEEVSSDRLLHDHDPSFVATDPMFQAKRVIRLRGQVWTIMVQSKSGAVFGSQAEEQLPLWVFSIGIVLTTIVTTYFVVEFWKHLRKHSPTHQG